jgi:SAM-dependent methyltransferase
MARVDWVRNFYAKQYEWADWRHRWSDFDPNDRDPRVDAVTRHAGSPPLRILELGSGTGTTAAALAVAGHDVVAIEMQGELAAYTQELAAVVTGGSLRAIAGDFFEAEPPGRFDVVAYFDGFGIGSDEDQRRLLRRIVGWLVPDGCALIDVLVPWYWAGRAGNEEEFPTGSGVRYLDGFDSGGCRMTERMWRVGQEDDAVTQSLRCYSPADLRLLLEGTGLSVVGVEPFTDEGYSEPCELADAMLYLATLAPRDGEVDPATRGGW